MKFSYFKAPIKNTIPDKAISLQDAYLLIEDPSFYQTKTNELRRLIRNNEDKSAARKYKADKLDYVTFAGVFNSRKEDDIISKSGYMCIDIDDLEDAQHTKQELSQDDLLKFALLFTSPSGNGVKGVIQVPEEADYLEYFQAVSIYLEANYEDLEVDKSGKDLSRACFLCHDPEAILGEEFNEFPYKDWIPKQSHKQDNGYQELNFEEEESELFAKTILIIDRIIKEKVDITEDYSDWISWGFGISQFGEKGREYFHKLSSLYPGYDKEDVDRQYDICLTTPVPKGKNPVTVRSLFKLSREMFPDIPIIMELDEDDEPKRQFLSFPYKEVLPESAVTVLEMLRDKLNFPVDFTAAAMLFAGSVAIGNSFRIQPYVGWTEGCLLYMAIVGAPGTNKSHPLSFAMQPIMDLDNEYFEEYERQKAEYKEDSTSNPKPVLRKIIVTDATKEALTHVHQYNRRGIAFVSDELAGWFKNFARYTTGGSDDEFWLSNWSGKTISVIRKSSDPIQIKHPFIGVIGTIQTNILNELGRGGKANNGFIDRLLMVMPPKLKIPHKDIKQKEADDSTLGLWSTIIRRIIDNEITTVDFSPTILPLTDEAKQAYFTYSNKLVDESNELDMADPIRGVNAKMDIMYLRFALIIEVLRWADYGEASSPTFVSLESCNKAKLLCDYFKQMNLAAIEKMTSADPVVRLPENKQKLYKMLPDGKFTRSDAVKAGKMAGMKRASVDRFLKSGLFKKTDYGYYTKKI